METLSKDYQPKIVVLGGGSAYNIARGIAETMPDALITIGQAGTDHGGGSGKLRDAYDVAAPGDSCSTIAALSPYENANALYKSKFSTADDAETFSLRSDQVLDAAKAHNPDLDDAWLALQLDIADNTARDLMDRGVSLKGQAWGNVLQAGIAHESGSMDQALKAASLIMGLAENHEVVQTSDTPTDIRMHDIAVDGTEVVIEGEGEIDEYHVQSPAGMFVELTEQVEILPQLAERIREADAVVIAAGSFATSVTPALLARGTEEAFGSSNGKIIAVANLTEDGVMPSLPLPEFVEKLDKLTNPTGQGRNVDVIAFNDSPDALPVGEKAITFDAHDLDKLRDTRVLIGKNLVAKSAVVRDVNDTVARRANVHHDGTAFAGVVQQFIPRLQSEALAA